jgi:hypothetical protein
LLTGSIGKDIAVALIVLVCLGAILLIVLSWFIPALRPRSARDTRRRHSARGGSIGAAHGGGRHLDEDGDGQLGLHDPGEAFVKSNADDGGLAPSPREAQEVAESDIASADSDASWDSSGCDSDSDSDSDGDSDSGGGEGGESGGDD